MWGKLKFALPGFDELEFVDVRFAGLLRGVLFFGGGVVFFAGTVFFVDGKVALGSCDDAVPSIDSGSGEWYYAQALGCVVSKAERKSMRDKCRLRGTALTRSYLSNEHS